VSDKVVQFVEANGPKRTHLWFNRCSKIRDSQITPLRPIVTALKYNRHYRTFMLTACDRPAILSALSGCVWACVSVCALWRDCDRVCMCVCACVQLLCDVIQPCAASS
jgi:hypothetical protein